MESILCIILLVIFVACMNKRMYSKKIDLTEHRSEESDEDLK